MYFEQVRDHVRAHSTESKIESDDTGTRQALTTWIELALKEAFEVPADP